MRIGAMPRGIEQVLTDRGLCGMSLGATVEELRARFGATLSQERHDLIRLGDEITLLMRDERVVEVTWIRGFSEESAQRDAGNAVRRELRRRFGVAEGARRFPAWRSPDGRIWTSQWHARATPDGTKGLYFVKVVLDHH